MARRPLRTTCTGIAWSLSVSSVTSETKACTRVTWPMTPISSTTGLPGAHAMLRAAVDDHLPRERVAAGVEDLRRQRLALDALGRADQAPQLRGFRRRGLEALRALRRRRAGARAALRSRRAAATAWRSIPTTLSHHRRPAGARPAAGDRRPAQARCAGLRRSESARPAPAGSATAKRRMRAGRAVPGRGRRRAGGMLHSSSAKGRGTLHPALSRW